jgi:hypothetical protein
MVTVTVVAQWAKAPGIHCYVAGSIPAVIPRYCTKKIEKMLFRAQKKQRKKKVWFTVVYNTIEYNRVQNTRLWFKIGRFYIYSLVWFRICEYGLQHMIIL